MKNHIIASTGLLLLLSTQIKAEIVKISAPIDRIVQSECGESVALVGFLHGEIQETTKGTETTYATHTGPRGDAFAIGLESGIKYNLVGETFNRFTSDASFLRSFTYINVFKIVGLYSVHQETHVLLNEDGSIKVMIDNSKADCK